MMGKDFCAEKEKSYLLLLDANNLYGGSLSSPLPVGGFQWVNSVSNLCLEDDVDMWTNLILQMEDDGDKGYFFQVDLEYPQTLHDQHDDYPLCPVKMQIENHRLSEYQQSLSEQLNINLGGGEKLCLTLEDKESYICHFTSLKLYLSLGMKLKKIHKILQFRQQAWAKSYIELNTTLRRNASSPFEESMSKFFNNNLFGKTIENTYDYSHVIVTNSPEKAQKYLNRLNLKDFEIITNKLVMMSFNKKTVLLNKPRAIGSSVLEKSKTSMYSFHYNFMKKIFPNIRLMFTDTDSLLYFIQSNENIYKVLKKHGEHFDFSNYNVKDENYSNDNRLIPLKFKDELGGRILDEFVGLRSKLYSLKTVDGVEKKTSKGTLKNITQTELVHEDYKESLFGETTYYNAGVKIMHENNMMYSVNLRKQSLNPINDKKFVTKNLDGSFQTLSFGHFLLGLSNDQSHSVLKIKD